MKIKSIHVYSQTFALTRPYTIAYKTEHEANNLIVEIQTESGMRGLGAGSFAATLTGETLEDSIQCLQDVIPSLENRDMLDFKFLIKECHNKLSCFPAASAALNIALYDLYGKILKKPLVAILGQTHQQLPTSITIGIKNVVETLKEAQEYVDRGFFILKVKLGHDLNEDIERLVKLREQYAQNIILRVDPNQGYIIDDLLLFIEKTEDLNIEMIEQPISVSRVDELLRLQRPYLKKIALDESVVTPHDALAMLSPQSRCGIFNVKLMKCGGIDPALKIAKIAHKANIDLMWGCMDESIISIAAALHTAFSCPATKYIDLDGSFDLANDIVTGGFTLKNGMMSPLNLPGLGVEKK